MLLMPIPIGLILLLTSFILLLRHRQRAGLVTLALTFVLLFAFSTPMLPNALLRPLELTHKQFDLSAPVEFIVILGCGHTNDGALPITAQIKPCSTIRIVEALRIGQFNPQAKYITSGNTLREPFSNAEMNRDLLIALGVPEQRIITLSTSRDTEDEAENIAPIVGDKPFALVTSASHMSRASKLFKAKGLSPLFAPTEHLVRLSGGPSSLILSNAPNSKNLKKTERWWYETLGHSWLYLKGLFSD